MANKLTQPAIDLIRKFEGEVLRVYKDPVGLITVGVGHLVKKNEPYKLGQQITRQESERLLREDLKGAEKIVSTLISAPLTNNQFGALVSFVFNLGEANFRRSTLRQTVNRQQYTKAADEFLKWSKARKDGELITLPGLVKRRKAERALFLTKE